jgi:hypothetical protein
MARAFCIPRYRDVDRCRLLCATQHVYGSVTTNDRGTYTRSAVYEGYHNVLPRINETVMHEPAKEEGLLYYCMLNVFIGRGEVLLRWLYTIELRDCIIKYTRQFNYYKRNQFPM